MLFNSYEFALFFPIVTIVYFLLPHKFRWPFLLGASCLFYMALIPVYIFILLGTIVVDYLAGLGIEHSVGVKRKVFLICSIIANVGVLAFFKYFNFFASNIEGVAQAMGIQWSAPLLNLLLPVGLSFHTFQAMAYTVEVYRGQQPAERHFGIYSLYVMFYPQLVAGPIERPQNLIHQFKEHHRFSSENLAEGSRLMLWGLFKKTVIADRLAPLVNLVYGDPQAYSPFMLLLATYAFAIQIYCDFSGYSDIAIGAARVMGFKLMTNFNRPYFAHSVQDFWRRWHISLSTWFRDYLYVPMGGNRFSGLKTSFNIFVVFLVSGLWHGANWTYVVWGALHGLYILLARLIPMPGSSGKPLERLFKVGCILLTFNLVCISWIFFRAKTLPDAMSITQRIIVECPVLIASPFTGKWAGYWQNLCEVKIEPSEWFLGCVFIAVLAFIEYGQEHYQFGANWTRVPLVARWLSYYACAFCIAFLAGSRPQEFIYFQF